MKIRNEMITQSSPTIFFSLKRPTFTYASLIVDALSMAPDKSLPVRDIYKKIITKHEYYRYNYNNNWENGMRRAFTLTKCFSKVHQKNQRGHLWIITPGNEYLFAQTFERLRQSPNER